MTQGQEAEGQKRRESESCAVLRRRVKGGALVFLRKHQANPASATAWPGGLATAGLQPAGGRRPRPAAQLPSNAARLPSNAAAPARPARPSEPQRAPASPSQPRPTRKARELPIPLFSSVLPRAGCREAAGGEERESSRWAGIAAAAPPASGVKERPWHPSPQGSVSSTLGNRARPAPTAVLPLPGQPPGAPACALAGACGFAWEADAAEDAEEETDRASGSPGEGTWKGPGWGRKWAWRGSGGPRARPAGVLPETHAARGHGSPAGWLDAVL